MDCEPCVISMIMVFTLFFYIVLGATSPQKNYRQVSVFSKNFKSKMSNKDKLKAMI